MKQHVQKETAPTLSEVDSNGLDEATKLVGQIKGIVGNVPALSTKDRVRSIKLRKGGETVIPTVATLSNQFGLTVASHPTTTMVEKAKRAQSLIPLHKQLVTATIIRCSSASPRRTAIWKQLSPPSNSSSIFKKRSPAVIAEETAKKEARKAAKAAEAAAKAAAKTETTPDATASASMSVAAPLAEAPLPTVSAAPATPAPISAAST